MFKRTITIKISCDESTPIPTTPHEAVILLTCIKNGSVDAEVNILHNENLGCAKCVFPMGHVNCKFCSNCIKIKG